MTGSFYGPKGGVCTWGEIGNYVQPEEFVIQLIPFWRELLLGKDMDDGLPSPHAHVIVFCEREEQRGSAYEIYRTPHGDPEQGEGQLGILLEDLPEGEIVIYRHENLPFRWNQY